MLNIVALDKYELGWDYSVFACVMHVTVDVDVEKKSFIDFSIRNLEFPSWKMCSDHTNNPSDRLRCVCSVWWKHRLSLQFSLEVMIITEDNGYEADMLIWSYQALSTRRIFDWIFYYISRHSWKYRVVWENRLYWYMCITTPGSARCKRRICLGQIRSVVLDTSSTRLFWLFAALVSLKMWNNLVLKPSS